MRHVNHVLNCYLTSYTLRENILRATMCLAAAFAYCAWVYVLLCTWYTTRITAVYTPAQVPGTVL